MTDEVVVFESVTRRYPPIAVGADDLTLRLPAGTSFGLLGRNGAGKTTTLRLAMGMLRPDSGRVRVLGHDPFAHPERARLGIGYVAEDQELPENLFPRDLFALYRDLYPGWDDAFAAELGGRLGLPGDRWIRGLSKGEKRIAALVCAVAHRPRLLLLDEPGGGLDPVTRRGLLTTVVDLLAEADTTVVFSSHLLAEVERVSNRIGILHRGRLLVDEATDRLRDGACRLAVTAAEDGDLEKIAGCVRVAPRGDGFVLTFLAGEEEARARLSERGLAVAGPAQTLSLEDLFIDLVGDESPAGA